MGISFILSGLKGFRCSPTFLENACSKDDPKKPGITGSSGQKSQNSKSFFLQGEIKRNNILKSELQGSHLRLNGKHFLPFF